MSNRVYIYRLFERIWHWAQAALIISLLATGFEVHGSYGLFGFERAVDYHTIAAWSLIGLWVFAIFWHLITGEWRQYIPTLEKIDVMMKYYSAGILKGEPHPFRKTVRKKHNPLQRLTYLLLLAVVGPITWISGVLYLFNDQWTTLGLAAYLSLPLVALFHTAAAFLFLAFLISHIYLATTGETLTAHVKAMVTGWETEH